MSQEPWITFTIQLSPDDLRELAGILSWAVFHRDYKPHTCSREHLEGLVTQIGFQALQLAQEFEASQEQATLRDQIRVFFNANDPQQPYRLFLSQSDMGIQVLRLRGLSDTVAICKQYGLPVVTEDPQLSADLRAHGIEAELLYVE